MVDGSNMMISDETLFVLYMYRYMNRSQEISAIIRTKESEIGYYKYIEKLFKTV